MNTKDMIRKAKGLASKYKDSQETDDLIQEGLLAGLEASVNTTDDGEIVNAMRRAMNDFYNISLKPVSLPKSGQVRDVLAKVSRETVEEPHWTGTELSIFNALTGEMTPLEGNIPEDKEKLEQDLNTDHIMTKAKGILSGREYKVIEGLFMLDKEYRTVAIELGVSKSTVSTDKLQALKKLKGTLR